MTAVALAHAKIIVAGVGLRALLPRDEFEIVAEARDGSEAIEAAARHQPDVVLLEVALRIVPVPQSVPRFVSGPPMQR